MMTMLRNNEIKANAVDVKEKDKQLLCSCGQNTQHVPYIKYVFFELHIRLKHNQVVLFKH